MGPITQTLHAKLTTAFAPTRLEITDESSRHAGHAGSSDAGESQAFAGANKVARQRMIYKALAEELAGPVHALSLKALAPGEA